MYALYDIHSHVFIFSIYYVYDIVQVVVDDICMGVTEVVRGGDLLLSTARQILLHRALGGGGVEGGAEGGVEGGEGEETDMETQTQTHVQTLSNNAHSSIPPPYSSASPSTSSSSSSTSSLHLFPSSLSSPLPLPFPYSIPSYYHCDLVRDPATEKRIAKRNQPTQDPSECERTADSTVLSGDSNDINFAIEMSESKNVIPTHLHTTQSSTYVSTFVGDSSKLHGQKIHHTLPIATPATSSTVAPEKMGTDSDMFTLRYLRENGYTPDQIRTEILGLTCDTDYD